MFVNQGDNDKSIDAKIIRRMMVKTTDKKNSVPMVMLIIVFSKLIGMFRDVVLANYYGTSNVSDAYLIASSVPTLLFYFIGHSISTAYIPMYNKVKHEGDEQQGLSYTNNIINVSLLISTVLFLIIMIWPEKVILLFASGFDLETVKITVGLIRINAGSIYFMVLVSVLSGYLNANKCFIVPAAISLPRNGIIIASIVVSSVLGIKYLGWGLFLSYVAEFMLLIPFSIKKGYRYSCRISINDQNIRETGYIILPILLGMSVGQINKIVDRSLASVVCEGGISALTYASVINNAVQEILVTGILTVLFAHSAEWVAKGEHQIVKEKLKEVVNILIMFLLPATVGVIVLARPIVMLLLARGEFNDNSIEMTSGALACYTWGLLFFAIRDTLTKVFYAYKNTKITTMVSVISIMLNIVLNFVMYHFIGLNGLALATSISAAFSCIALYVLLNKSIGDFGTKSNIIVIAKSLISSGIMAVAVILIYANTTFLTNLVRLIVSVIVGVAVYLVVALLLHMEPLDTGLNIKVLKNRRI